MRDPIDAAEQNYFAAWRLMTGRMEGGVVHETEDVLYTSIPHPVAFFNSAFVKPPADPLACVNEVRAYFAASGNPFTLRFRDAPGLDAAGEAAGLATTALNPVMNVAVDDVTPPATAVERADATSWADYVSVLCRGFDMPVDFGMLIFGQPILDSDDFVAFTARVDGEVAATAALVVSDGVAGVYNVATPEQWRRRGLGEAATRAAVAEGKARGCSIATLQSSDMGYPIYERMGFRTVVHWRSMEG